VNCLFLNFRIKNLESGSGISDQCHFTELNLSPKSLAQKRMLEHFDTMTTCVGRDGIFQMQEVTTLPLSYKSIFI